MKAILQKLLVECHSGMTDRALKMLFSEPNFSSIFDGVSDFGRDIGKLIEVIPAMYHLTRLSGAEKFYRLKSTKSNEVVRVFSLSEIKIGGADGGVDGIYSKGSHWTFFSCKFKNKRTINEIVSGRTTLEGVAVALVNDGEIDELSNCSYEIFLKNVDQFEDRRKNKRTTVHDWVELDRMFNELKVYFSRLNFSVSTVDSEIRKTLPPAYQPRFHQRLAIAWIIDCLTRGCTTLLLLLCARFGKTLMMCYLFLELNKRLGYRIFVLPAHWLSSHTSMRNTIYGSREFGHLRIVETKQRSSEDIIAELDRNLADGYLSVVFLSLYSTENFQEKVLTNVRTWLKSHYKVTVMLTDEADFGAHTDRAVAANAALLDLKDVTKLYLSGTGTARMAKGAVKAGNRIDDELAITMTDLQLFKKKKHPLFLV